MQRGDPLFPMFLHFATRRIWGDNRDIPGDTLLAVNIGDSLGAVVVFQNYDADNGIMEISAAAQDGRWLKRSVIREVFEYVFDQCKCQAAVLRCDAEDATMNKLARGLGFRCYEVPRLRGRNKAEAIHVLGDDEYRSGRFHRGK